MKLNLYSSVIGALQWMFLVVIIPALSACSSSNEPEVIPVSQDRLMQQAFDKNNNMVMYKLPEKVKHSDLTTLDDLRKYVHFGAVGGGRWDRIWQFWMSDNGEPFYNQLNRRLPYLPITANGYDVNLRALTEDKFSILEVHRLEGKDFQTFTELTSIPGLICEQSDENSFKISFKKTSCQEPVYWEVCFKGTKLWNVKCLSCNDFHQIADIDKICFVQLPFNDDVDYTNIDLNPFDDSDLWQPLYDGCSVYEFLGHEYDIDC